MEVTCGLPIELLCLAILSSYAWEHIEYTSSDKQGGMRVVRPYFELGLRMAFLERVCMG